MKRVTALVVVLGMVLALPLTAFAEEKSDEASDGSTVTVNDSRDDTRVVDTKPVDRPDVKPTDRPDVKPTDRPPTDVRPDIDIDGLKRRALAAIERRLMTIDRLVGAIQQHDAVSDRASNALLVEARELASGLEDLAQKIKRAETREEVVRLARLIVTEFRIYTVFSPKVHLVLAAGTVLGYEKRFELVAEHLAALIERVANAGGDVTKAKEYFEVMVSHFRAALDLAGDVAPKVLPLTAADWPEPAQETLRSARGDLDGARKNIRAGVDALHNAIKALREALGG